MFRFENQMHVDALWWDQRGHIAGDCTDDVAAAIRADPIYFAKTSLAAQLNSLLHERVPNLYAASDACSPPLAPPRRRP